MESGVFARQMKSHQASKAATDGRVIYAVGDVHGRLDLLNALLAQIEADRIAVRPAARPLLVFMGDYVDRGPASMGVIDRIVGITRRKAFETVALMGNHEQTLLQFLGDARAGPIWVMHGGKETLVDYGIIAPFIDAAPAAWEAARNAFVRALPRRHREFLAGLRLQAACGDYFFAHAGVRPGVPLGQQAEQDLLTIRRDFLAANAPFGKVVVHGHTPTEEPYSGPNRINVDTGAYASGVLTAVRLEGAERRFIQSRAASPPSVRGRSKLADFRARWTPDPVR